METEKMSSKGGLNSDLPEESMQGNISDNREVILKKKVTLLRGIAFIVGTIIGSGIFITPKGVLMNSGNMGMSLVVWAVCGIFSLLGALCYAELGTCIKKSGGHYTYILEMYGPLLAFLRVWVELIVIRPAANALASLAFGRYILEPFFMPCTAPESAIKIIGILAMMIVFYINSSSITCSARIQIIFTIVKLVAIAIIIISGIAHLVKDSSNFNDAFVGEVTISKLPLALYAGMYAYAGWFYLNFVIEEVENPEKTMPIAICVSMAITTFCYLFLNVSYFAVMTTDEVLLSDAVAVTFAERKLGNFYLAIPVFVALSCFGSVNGGTFAVARVFYVASREGHLPQILSMIHPQKHTPLPAVVVLFPLMVVMTVSGNISSLLNFVSFVRWLFIGLVVAGSIYLRFKYPAMPRPFKVPLFIPAVFCIFCFSLIGMSLYSDPVNTGIGFAISLTGIPVYYVFIKWDKKPKWFQTSIDYVTTSLQILLKVAPSDEHID